ncbi:MAG TPA: DUF1932 domain-containing protein [Micropepsaceae bacterium]|nr:DUF1932 domain-containing protein [Micropepsaceae bacterium]
MTPLVAIIAPGAMGSAVAGRLHEHGVRVLTSLSGRSPESASRARAAGMTDVPPSELAQADILLSIVPPGCAHALAKELAAEFASAAHKPLYVDCNAINPQTAARVADIIRAGGMDYVDAGIIGGPPRRGYNGPVFYLSGEYAKQMLALGDLGLDCRVLTGGPFAASALKMSYAGITKGLTALASMMIAAAANAGAAGELRTELAHSQPGLLAWFERQIPSMFPKAYRWVAEMEEIAGFVKPQPDAEKLFHAVAGFYRQIADESGAPDVKILSGFFAAADRPQ